MATTLRCWDSRNDGLLPVNLGLRAANPTRSMKEEWNRETKAVYGLTAEQLAEVDAQLEEIAASRALTAGPSSPACVPLADLMGEHIMQRLLGVLSWPQLWISMRGFRRDKRSVAKSKMKGGRIPCRGAAGRAVAGAEDSAPQAAAQQALQPRGCAYRQAVRRAHHPGGFFPLIVSQVCWHDSHGSRSHSCSYQGCESSVLSTIQRCAGSGDFICY